MAPNGTLQNDHNIQGPLNNIDGMIYERLNENNRNNDDLQKAQQSVRHNSVNTMNNNSFKIDLPVPQFYDEYQDNPMEFM